MKVVINKCYGGFSLSYKAEMEYAKRKGITLYPFIEKIGKDGRIDFHHFVPYTGQKNLFLIHYATKPLKKDGTYEEDYYYSTARYAERNDPILIKVIEKLGKKASGEHADLEIVEIPDGVSFEIEEYDGQEWISEVHKTWR